MDANRGAYLMRSVFTIVAAFALSASAAGASTITLSTFDSAQHNALLSGLGNTIIGEDFESFAEMNVGGIGSPFVTSVGSFQTLGGTGTGGTVRRADNTFTGPSGANPNDGTQLAIRDGNVFGRVSTTSTIAGGGFDPLGTFLDSNDTFGISWDVDFGGRAFNRILFTLTDAADTGATVTISDNTGGFAQFQSQPRSNQKTVLIDFNANVTQASLLFSNTSGPNGGLRTNDGLGLDDIAISVLPLPAPIVLFLSAFLGLGLIGRKWRSA